MRKFNEFNESKDVNDKLYQWLRENIKYTDEDILYYFSEFTDEWECEYLIELGEYSSTEELIKEFPENIDQNIVMTLTFLKKFNKENFIDEYIKLGNALKKYNSCINQFKTLEEDISFEVGDRFHVSSAIRERGNNDGEYLELFLIFYKVIPDDIFTQYNTIVTANVIRGKKKIVKS